LPRSFGIKAPEPEHPLGRRLTGPVLEKAFPQPNGGEFAGLMYGMVTVEIERGKRSIA
jgi:hypothetical protein